MKKLLGMLFALALVVPAMAGNIFSNVETYGEVQTIGSMTENAVDPSTRDVSNRVILGLGMDLVEDVRANVSFLNTSYWGRANTLSGDNVDDNFLQDTYLVEANLAVSNVFGALDVKVGRQFYGDEDSSIIYFGPTHYRANLRAPSGADPSYATITDSLSLDGVVISYTGDNWTGNILYAKLTDTFDNNDEDISVGGFDVKANLTDNIMGQVYMYDIRDGANDPKEHHFGVWGVKPTYADDMFSVSAEFAKNYEDQIFGQNDRGWLLKADLKANYAFASADVNPRFTYAHTEKSFATYGNYMPGLIFSSRVGKMFSILGANEDGLRVVNPGVDLKFAGLDKFSFAFDYFAITFDDPTTSTGANWLGNEFNLMAKYALNEYVEFHAAAGYATNVNQGFAHNNEDPYMGQLGMIVKF